jgi:hypothetical protein
MKFTLTAKRGRPGIASETRYLIRKMALENEIWGAIGLCRVDAQQERLSPLDLKDSRIPAGGSPSWAKLNLRGGVTVAQRVHLGLALENLTNATYKHHGPGVWMPGFNAALSVGVDI